VREHKDCSHKSATHGTTETSTVSTAYDFNTGLPLTVTDDFGQTTATENALRKSCQTAKQQSSSIDEKVK
jgi:hypothetical protein